MSHLADKIPYDAWLAIVGALAAAACAIPGTFLMLRRLSLMGDAISHAVLPGLVLAYIFSESRASVPMLIGAISVGLLTAFIIETLRRVAKVEEGASIGIVFTSLFAMGIVLITTTKAKNVDLDPNCILQGALETVTMNTIAGIPVSAIALGAVFLVNAALVVFLFKEFRICSFDPGLAATLGFRPVLMHYLLMTMTALTCVVAFEAVGSILVVALLIVPAAAAHLLTDRLSITLLLAVGIAIGSSLAGQWVATFVPGQFGFGSVSITGTTATMTGIVLAIAIAFSPKHGVVARTRHRKAIEHRIAREDVLGVLCRQDEVAPGIAKPTEMLRKETPVPPGKLTAAITSLVRDGWVTQSTDGIRLTDAGKRAALDVLRSHRLWETYLAEVANVPADHTHAQAHRLEHVGMSDAVSAETKNPDVDPHHKPIPPTQ